MNDGKPKVQCHVCGEFGHMSFCSHLVSVNKALFSVVNGVLLNPLPYEQPDRLVAIYAKTKEFSQSSISYPNYLDWVRNQRSFSSLAAFREDNYNLTGMGEPERVKAEMVSASFFSVLGVNPVA